MRYATKDQNRSCFSSREGEQFLDDEIKDYDLQIEGLEKKRRFLLDKLPFLKK